MQMYSVSMYSESICENIDKKVPKVDGDAAYAGLIVCAGPATNAYTTGHPLEKSILLIPNFF